MRRIQLLVLSACLLGFAGAAHAVPYETFVLDQTAVSGGAGAGGAGTVTILQLNLDEVQVTVSMSPNIVINTSNGNSHTPFAFNLSPYFTTLVNAGLGITVTQPTTQTQCGTAPAPCFSPTYTASPATPYGMLSEGLAYTGNNGTNAGYSGDLVFTVSAAGIGNVTPSGSFSAFAPNNYQAVFAADLYNATTGKTGTFASFAGTPGGTTIGGGGSNPVPEPASLLLLGSGLLGLGALRQRRRRG